MTENQTYKIQGARVYGEGTSYNCTNNITATELCHKLNTLTTNHNITQQLTQIQNTLQNIEQQITTLNKTLKK